MKAVKIVLAVAVIVTIGCFVWKSLVEIGDPDKIPAPKNQFVERIEQEIDSLSKMPDNAFCKDFYKEVSYHIADDYKNARFGSNNSENKQWNTNLTNNLYAAYTDKFIKQAFYVFQHSEWEVTSLNFIRNEKQTLQESALLEKNSPIADSFTKIQQILSKYDEVSDFIYNCRNFPFPSNYSMASQFPISEVKSKISGAKEYLNKRLDNEYVNNCTRLHAGLNEVSQILFSKHVTYLNNKIQHWTDLYANFNSQADYSRNLYQPLKSEIDLLDMDTYGVSPSIFDSNYSRLKNKLGADSQKAYNYFSSK
jgi:hypothetical protein